MTDDQLETHLFDEHRQLRYIQRRIKYLEREKQRRVKKVNQASIERRRLRKERGPNSSGPMTPSTMNEPTRTMTKIHDCGKSSMESITSTANEADSIPNSKGIRVKNILILIIHYTGKPGMSLTEPG